MEKGLEVTEGGVLCAIPWFCLSRSSTLYDPSMWIRKGFQIYCFELMWQMFWLTEGQEELEVVVSFLLVQVGVEIRNWRRGLLL